MAQALVGFTLLDVVLPSAGDLLVFAGGFEALLAVAGAAAWYRGGGSS
jgi:hypothetical protein